jgi:hypothetical protein
MEAFEEEERKKRIGLVLSGRDLVWTIVAVVGLFGGLMGWFAQVQPYIAAQERWEQKVDDNIQEIKVDQTERDAQIDEILRAKR